MNTNTIDAVTMPAPAALSTLPVSAVRGLSVSGAGSMTAGSWRERFGTDEIRVDEAFSTGSRTAATAEVRVPLTDAVSAAVSHHNSIAATAGLSGYAVVGAAKQAFAAKPAAPPRGEPR